MSLNENIWRCGYVDASGDRCGCVASRRIHFSQNHPFDHLDLCNTHLKEYKFFVWYQPMLEGRLV